MGTQTVITVIGDTQQVQVARSGEPLSLLVTAQAVATVGLQDSAPLPGDVSGGERDIWTLSARDLLQLAGDEGAAGVRADTAASTPTVALLTLARADLHRYPRRADEL